MSLMTQKPLMNPGLASLSVELPLEGVAQENATSLETIRRLRPWQAYLISVAVTVGTLLLRIALNEELQGQPALIIFTLPIMLAAFVGGMRAGLLATALSVFLADYFLLAPLYGFAIHSVAERYNISLLLFSGLVISGLHEKLDRARRRANIADSRLAEIVQSSEACFAIDGQGRFTFVNDRGVSLLRFARAKMLSQPIAEVFTEIFGDPMEAERNQATAGQVSVSFEVLSPTARRWIDVRLFPAGDGLAAFVLDINDRKLAEAAAAASDHSLRASEARYRSTLDSMLETCQIISFDWTYLYLNTAAAAHNRRPNSELLGKKMTDVWPGLQGTEAFALLKQSMEERIPTHKEVEFIFPDGVKGWFDIRCQPVPEGIFMLSMNITERKLAEAALSKATALQRAIFDTANFSMIATDKAGVVQIFNVGAERMLGYCAAEVVNEKTALEFHEQDEVVARAEALSRDNSRPVMPNFDALVFKAARGAADIYEMTKIRKDGTRFPAAVSVTALRNEQSAIIGYLLVATDNTERKQAADVIRQMNADLEQRVLERTAQLTTVNKELEAFSYSVSHDLRSPLRSIDGFSLALLEDYADKLDDTGKSHLNRVRAASQRMGRLIDDLLNLSRVSRIELLRESVDMSKIAREIEEELHTAAPDRDVKFVIADGMTAQTDPRLLRIVLDNLLGNAWKFTAKKSRAQIEFGSIGENGSTSYYVRDNGAGFDMQYAGKLFGAFQRLHEAKDFPGTGVGLATVQRIIQRQGGHVWAESEMDVGTTFRFTL